MAFGAISFRISGSGVRELKYASETFEFPVMPPICGVFAADDHEEFQASIYAEIRADVFGDIQRNICGDIRADVYWNIDTDGRAETSMRSLVRTMH